MKTRTEKVFGNAARLGISVALAFPLTTTAETIARAIVTQSSGSVCVYDIDENDTWTQSKKLVDVYSTQCRDPYHSVYKNGIVFISDKGGHVYKYDLSANLLGTIDLPGFVAEGLAVTPDGSMLFVGGKTQEGEAKVFKVDVSTEAVSEFCNLGSRSVLRDMEVDGSGHLYVTDRDLGMLHIFNYAADEDADVPTSVPFNFCEGVGWNPIENLIYVAGNSGEWGIFYPDGTVHTALTIASNNTNGWCTGVTCINGQMYYASYTDGKVYRLDAAQNDFIEVEGVLPNPSIRDFRGSDVTVVVVDTFEKTQWGLNDANGVAVSMNDAGTLPFNFEGDVRLAADGVDGNCAFFASGRSRITVADSDDFVPATGDFAVFFWVGLPAVATTEGPRHLFSNAIGAGGDFALVADAGGLSNTLGLSFTPVGSDAEVEINSPAIVADGRWHHVGVVRKGAKLELWMDAERVGVADVAQDVAIASDRTWSFGSDGHGYGGFVGAGAFYDEVVFTVDPPPLRSEIALITAGYTFPQSSPAIPNSPVAQPMPSSLGTEIAHVFANVEKIFMPSILIGTDGDYYVSCDHGNGACDPGRATTLYRSADRGASWEVSANLQGHSISLFEQDGVLCAVGLKAGLGYPASMRTFTVWTNATVGGFAEAANFVAPMDCKVLPSPVVVTNGTDRKVQLVLAVSADNGGTLSPAWVRFDVVGREFSNGSFSVNSRGFVSSSVASMHTSFADALGGIVIPKGVNFLAMHPVIDRKSTVPEVLIGPERVAYQNVLGSGIWSRFRYNQFRGGAKPFNVRYDAQSSVYYAVTVPSTNGAELVNASADKIVGTLALYASPDPELMAWYPCGVLDASDEFGFTAPAFAFDGDDLVLACAISAPDGCGTRGRDCANFLSFRRIPAFRTTHAVQTPDKNNRTRAYMVVEHFIMKYYRTADGEWQPDGVLVGDTFEEFKYGSPAAPKVRGKKLFVLNSESANFCALDFSGKQIASYAGPSGLKVYGMDISHDGTRALLACGDMGVWECNLLNNTWNEVVAKGGDLVNARDVAILSDGGFLVTNYGYGDLYPLHYDAQGVSTRLPMRNIYFTGVATDPAEEFCFVGKTHGSIWSVKLLDNTYSLIRGDIEGYPFNGTYFLCYADGKLWVSSQSGFNSVYNPKTGTMEAPLVQHDYPMRGIALYEYQEKGFIIRIR